MIDTILFDLDNTLLDFSKAEKEALSNALKKLDIVPTKEVIALFSQINQEQWRLLEQKKITREQVKQGRFSLLFQRLGLSRSPQEAARIYESALSMEHPLMDGAWALLSRLFGQYRLYAVTNGTASVQKSRLKASGIEPYFQDVFISEEIGVNKPDALYFSRCFAQIPSFLPAQAVIVGDSLTSDIQGGKNAGIRTIWFHPDSQPGRPDIVPDYEIRKLSELPSLLNSINL